MTLFKVIQLNILSHGPFVACRFLIELSRHKPERGASHIMCHHQAPLLTTISSKLLRELSSLVVFNGSLAVCALTVLCLLFQCGVSTWPSPVSRKVPAQGHSAQPGQEILVGLLLHYLTPPIVFDHVFKGKHVWNGLHLPNIMHTISATLNDRWEKNKRLSVTSLWLSCEG